MSDTSKLAYTCRVGGADVASTIRVSEPSTFPVDATDLRKVHDAARAQARAAPGADVTCSRIRRERATSDRDMQWIRRGMTPSCAAFGWDPNNVASFDKWSCRYTGMGTVTDKDGTQRRVHNPMKRWSGTIASCDAPDPDSFGIPDATMGAVQRLAYHRAGGDESELDLGGFLCRVESLPRL